MFEYFIAKKYLIPKKNQLSVSLIAMMSVAVISLVVWLVLIFLSVTEGIEKNWLKKLTDLNAPLRVTPTQAYYESYYHLIDSQSLASNYTLKSLRHKRLAEQTDPYDPEQDAELPIGFPSPDLTQNFQVKDLVKELYQSVDDLKKNYQDVVISDFEATGALLKLKLLRPAASSLSSSSLDHQSFLTQMTYIAPICPESAHIHSLLIPPTVDDAEHLLYLSSISQTESQKDDMENIKMASFPNIQKRLTDLLSYMSITQLKTSEKHFPMPYHFIQENAKFHASAYINQGQISHLLIPKQSPRSLFFKKPKSSLLVYGTIEKHQGRLFFSSYDKSFTSFLDHEPLYIEDKITFKANLLPESISNCCHINNVLFHIEGLVQNQKIHGATTLKDLKLDQVLFSTQSLNNLSPPPWPYYKTLNPSELLLPSSQDKDKAIILPKNYKDSGVKIGDKGYLSFAVATASAMQEQRLPIFVAGFYDSGIMAVGAKCALMDPDSVHFIASSSQSATLDKNLSTGFQIWFKDLSQTQKIKKDLENLLKQKGLQKYFTLSTFYDYDFAKDLLVQFQSDKNLFSLIGVIILIVACSNIISFLVIMVNDKKKEIGIMQAMGASKKSLAIIFSSIGIILGLLGSVIGTTLALLTLYHIDTVVSFLSFLQGHDVFSSTFYGDSLPNTLSFRATIFVLIATPLLSFFAGLIPAKKACRIKPAQILRSET